MTLVTVITATHHRPELLQRAAASVRAQTWPHIEHLVVTDGPEDLDVPGARVIQLPRNWQRITPHWGAIPRAVGGYLARGEVVCYLDDDCAYLPHHVETLLGLLEDADAAAAAQRRDDMHGPVLTPARQFMRLDTSMVGHRAELLGQATWRAAGYDSDWDLFSRWDCRWAFTDEITSLYGAAELAAF